MWSHVVKGLKKENELETANSDKSWNGWEIANSRKTIQFGRIESLEVQANKKLAEDAPTS